MVKMNMLAQELVIRSYRTPEGGATKPQAHISTIMKGLRNTMEQGISNAERNRLVGLACTGHKISYTPCRWWKGNTCSKGQGCHHIHCG